MRSFWKLFKRVPKAMECPETQKVNRQRKGAFVTMTRLLLAETGKDLPAVKKMVGAA